MQYLRSLSTLTALLLSLGLIHSYGQSNISYRDLNHNGRMDIYEDARQTPQTRVNDLLRQMTLEEKTGELFHSYTLITDSGTIDPRGLLSNEITTDRLISEKKITHFVIASDVPARQIARFNNIIQKIAENTRLGIPITFSTDPKNGLEPGNTATTAGAGGFSEFPEHIGMAATRDTALMRRFGELAAREYRAVGITCGLSPQGDLATDPRWARISGTFGEDAALASQLMAAYIKGFQGDHLTPTSVMCISKHFPGNGPVKDGWESHFSYGRHLVYPGHNISYHLQPFKAAISAGTAGMMMSYGIVNDPTAEKENVGAAFDKQLVTDLLKNKLGYKGLILSDWNTLTAKKYKGRTLSEVKDWGMEDKNIGEKMKTEIMAGIDQFGGETAADTLTALVRNGQLTETRIDSSVAKILLLKFQLGLFDQPFVDENKVDEKVGSPAGVELGLEAQRKSLVLLRNEKNLLPLKHPLKIYEEGLDSNACATYGAVVKESAIADIVLLHLQTPYSGGLSNIRQEHSFHQGRLDFSDSARTAILDKIRNKPSIIIINLERPAVIPEIAAAAQVLIADFNARDQVILDAVFGKTGFSGRLPFELPSSMNDVYQQKEDLPHDTRHPLFPFGAGIITK